MIDVLSAEKGLYIENPELGYAHSGTTLYQMLGATYLGDGNYYGTGNVSSLAGQAGSFVAGMNYDYLYQQAPDNYVDYIGSNGGTLLFMSQDNNGRVICYAGPSSSYRSIYATCNFGAFRNGANTKLQLMTQYLNYLLQLVVTEESKEATVDGFSFYPNPATDRVNFGFTLSTPGHVRVGIYNTAGQAIRDLVDNEMSQGVHQIRWDGRDDSGMTVSSGTYLFTIEAGNTTLTKTIVLVK